MANPRIEEVDSDSASDPEEMDLDAFDFARPQGTLQPKASPNTQPTPTPQPPPPSSSSQLNRDPSETERAHLAKSKTFQTLYPLYFDSTRTRATGRRVPKTLAVPNPLARDLVDALQDLAQQNRTALNIVFEPTKTHPRDWANPGRVRVQLKADDTNAWLLDGGKNALYARVAKFLLAHPTTATSARRLQLQGMPRPRDGGEIPVTPVGVPRGWKVGEFLPVHSPAVSGGGVKENFLKDMIEEMGDEVPEGVRRMAEAAEAKGGGGMKKPKPIRVKR